MWLEFNIIDGRADVLSASLLLYDNNNKVILVRGRENILQHRDVIILFLENVLSNVFYLYTIAFRKQRRVMVPYKQNSFVDLT
jgi:hypothetical protein